ncbi:MAG: hypothetical protein P8J24_00070 [Arenicellales bacterium]|jgi:hypothetical protein|nr:hypothetical protein [Arenicellales bacterium]
MGLTELALAECIQSGVIENHCIAIQFKQAHIISTIEIARFYAYAGMGQT